MSMGSLIYALCGVAAGTCAVLLLQAYRRGGYRLLLWSGLCFVGLTINNLTLVADKIVVPHMDLTFMRTSIALVAMIVLLYGLIWDAK
jgi:hypothetical protein